MNFSIDVNIKDIYDDKIKEQIKQLELPLLEEAFKGNKVAFLYNNPRKNIEISFNPNICFYAASSIKILVCLMILEQAEQEIIDLNNKILITKEDLKQDTGIIKFQKEDTEYKIIDLIRLTITESDNTAYLKLVDIIGKENIKKYGTSLGALHTMEGKETDSFGIINCNDMLIYWKKVKEYIDSNKKYSQIFKNYLLNPSVKLIKNDKIDKSYVRKYGSWDIAYHEAGYVDNENPYYMIILTQLNQKEYKEKFINEIAEKIINIDSVL